MGGTVPLSEHEQRQLEQIEQALYADYPRFANAVRATDPRVHYKRRVFEAVLGFLIGVGLLLAGVVIKIIPLGVAGFVVMLACSMWAVTSYRHMTGITTARVPAKDRRPGKQRRAGKQPQGGKQPGKQPQPGKQSGSGLMERLEERWRRRQERDGG
jgi:predicted lipid-binding transport protein (Tim44 family)